MTLKLPHPLLPSESILVKQLIDGSISGQLFALFSYFGPKILGNLAIAFILVLFVLEGIQPIEHSPLFPPFLRPHVGLWLIGVLLLLLGLEVLL